MKFYTDSFKKGYKDFVNGFTPAVQENQYLDGYEAARDHFMNDIPYDEDIMVNPW